MKSNYEDRRILDLLFREQKASCAVESQISSNEGIHNYYYDRYGNGYDAWYGRHIFYNMWPDQFSEKLINACTKSHITNVLLEYQGDCNTEFHVPTLIICMKKSTVEQDSKDCMDGIKLKELASVLSEMLNSTGKCYSLDFYIDVRYFDSEDQWVDSCTKPITKFFKNYGARVTRLASESIRAKGKAARFSASTEGLTTRQKKLLTEKGLTFKSCGSTVQIYEKDKLVAVLHASKTEVATIKRRPAGEREYNRGIYKFEDNSLIDIIDATTTLKDFLDSFVKSEDK